MIRIILDRTVQMSEDEFKRGYKTLDIENKELEELLKGTRAFSICGGELIEEPPKDTKQ